MIEFSSDPKINQVANEQLNYYVYKYKQSQNPAIVQAKAESIIRNSLKNWNPSKGNLKTYLNGQLQQLSRLHYKNSPVYIPENQILLNYKSQQIINSYKDLHGKDPDPKYLAKELKISEKKAKDLLFSTNNLYSPLYETGTHESRTETYSPKEIIETIPNKTEREIAKDYYLRDKPTSYIFKKHNIKQTKFYDIKKNIDNHIATYSEKMNTEYAYE